MTDTPTAYVGIKFHHDNRNRSLVESLAEALTRVGVTSRVVIRDVERWGDIELAPSQLMDSSFELIRSSDVVVIELSEKGVGLGIEAGYAFAVGVPIVVAHREGTDISTTLKGLATEVIEYGGASDLSVVASRVRAIADAM